MPRAAAYSMSVSVRSKKMAGFAPFRRRLKRLDF
jgi:hypothetical protein